MRLFSIVVACAVLMWGASSLAQASQPGGRFPEAASVDRGGRLLAQVSETNIGYQGSRLVNIDEILDGSPLVGNVKPGDRIVTVNGYSFRDIEDFIKVASSGSPGTKIIIRILTADNKIYNARVKLVGDRGGNEPAGCASFDYLARADSQPLFIEIERDPGIIALAKETEATSKEADTLIEIMMKNANSAMKQQYAIRQQARRRGICATDPQEFITQNRVVSEADRAISLIVLGKH